MTDAIPGLPPAPVHAGPVALAVGSFDGVHRGHLHLLRRLLREAGRHEATAAALTLHPHPRCVVDPAGCPPLLTGVEERLDLLRQVAAEAHAVRFDAAMARWSATRFMRALLDWAPVRVLVAGPGFALGHRRQGDAAFLADLGRRWEFEVVSVDPLLRGGEPVSSSRIRAALDAGRVSAAAGMLGRHYTLAGRVVAGRGHGRRLGFPTANLEVDPDRCVPAAGVYAARVFVDGEWLPAATSVGTNPTYGTPLTIEPHILDWSGELYGRHLRIAFIRRLRAQRRYRQEGALIDQIGRDVERTRRVLR